MGELEKELFLEHFGRSMEPSQVLSGIESNAVFNVFGFTRSRYNIVIIFNSIIVTASFRRHHPMQKMTHYEQNILALIETISIIQSIAHFVINRNHGKQNRKLSEFMKSWNHCKRKTWHFRRWQNMTFIRGENMRFTRWQNMGFM